MTARMPACDELRRLEGFGEGYRMGYFAGQQMGHAHGEAAEAELWADALGVARRAAGSASAAELARRRAEVPGTPCPVHCGRFSRCVRADWLAGASPGRRAAGALAGGSAAA